MIARKNRGYSLIELLVVTVIFATISIVSVSLFLSTVISNSKTSSATEVKQEGDHMLNMMSHMIRNSIRVQDCPGSEITIVNRDANTTTFDLIVSPSRIASNGASLMSSTLTANSLVFTCVSVNGEYASVKIEFVLQKGVVGVESARDIVVEDFFTTVGLRNN